MKTKAAALAVLCAFWLCQNSVRAEDAPESPYGLRDRGAGVPTSLTGINLDYSEWVGVASYQDLENRGFQYAPEEFDFPDENDYLGKYTFSGGIFFLGYGLSDSVSLGLKVTGGSAKLIKAPDDPSAMPPAIKESGIGEIAPELTWRFMNETSSRPELYTFVSILIPHDTDKNLIGTQDWVVLPGFGLNRGFSWATLSARINFEYDAASVSQLDFGKWSIEGQRRFSDAWWLSAGFEGQVGGANNFDEVWQTTYVQWSASPHVAVRFGSRIGLTTMTEGWTGELGIVVR